jgi:hypothetical protein
MAGLAKHIRIDKLKESGMTEALYCVAHILNKSLKEAKVRQKIAMTVIATAMDWNTLSKLLLLINLLGNQAD